MTKKDLETKETRKKIEDKAKKSIIYKPLVYKKLYRLSTKLRKKIIKETIDKYLPNNQLTKRQKLKLKRDMTYARIKYNASFNEYFLFGFQKKNHFKRKSFITNRNRAKYLCYLGTKEGYDILKDKYKAYNILKKFYKRDLIKIEKQSDYEKFNDYIKKHPIFVKKPIDSSFGQGIELIDSKNYKTAKTLFNELIKESPIIIEEQIIQNEKMASLHPKSLNTIRMVTYQDPEGNIVIHLPFIKIGQGNSFVDNGGAGGILARIDEKTGKICTNGKDEKNLVYTRHPNTNIKLNGFEIPRWDEAKEYAKETAKAFQKTKYIGWDLALSKDNGWVIVEGNGKTQFIGQQITDEQGKRKDLEKLINYNKLKKNKNIDNFFDNNETKH